MKASQPNFDGIAQPYRWLEYLTLGRTLERCRLHFLADMLDRTSALVFGDGDGRFLAHLFRQNPALQADAVDISGAMLSLLRHRCPRENYLRTHQTGALEFLATNTASQYDLVITHFFLDCLTQDEVNQLAMDVGARLAPGTLWVVSDFAVPPGVMRFPATLLIRFLYLAFRVLTGLRVNQLPDHHAAFSAAGFRRVDSHSSLRGILVSELWKWHPGTSIGPAQ